ncbi:MAG: signal peptidase I [Actinomycetes bacterium]
MEERAGPEEIPEEETRRTPLWLELPGLLFTALAVAVVVKTFLIQPFYIPSESMLPTIEINDRVIVNKLAYRFGEPEPGDVVVVLNPALTDEQLQESIPEAVIRSILEAVGVRSRPEVDLIKRVVAVEGQTVEVADGRLYIDGVPQEEPYLLEPDIRGTFGPQVVPEGHVFLMGDNRNSSLDSRAFGPVPVEEIIGQAILRIWPLDRFGTL